jgi:hypothetical protein
MKTKSRYNGKNGPRPISAVVKVSSLLKPLNVNRNEGSIKTIPLN